MQRNCSLSEISDGKLYELNDMVKADCNNCVGCSACCHGMGNSIVLDPLDVHRLSMNRNRTFEELIMDKIELNVVDGLILPNIKMEEKTEKCVFLDLGGRCSIHDDRPGICRIFPLGRYYENHDFKYILQIHECKKKNRTKIKVSKWIDISNIKENQKYINNWHYFLKDIQELLQNIQNDEQIKQINLYVLNQFFVKVYDDKTVFYQQFEERLDQAKQYLGLVRA